MSVLKKINPVAIFFILLVLFSPLVAVAQNKTVENLITTFGDILNAAIPVVIGLGLLFFLLGLVRYVTAGENEEQQKAARNMILYGLVALFVMVAVWGLVRTLAQSFLGGSTGGTINAPKIPNN